MYIVRRSEGSARSFLAEEEEEFKTKHLSSKSKRRELSFSEHEQKFDSREISASVEFAIMSDKDVKKVKTEFTRILVFFNEFNLFKF